jgi:hypothetical protein
MAPNHMHVQLKPNTAPPVKCHLHFAPMKVQEQKFQFITTDCSEQTVVPYLLLQLTSASLIETLTWYFS